MVSAAAELITGRMVDATEALAIGMVDRVASDLPKETGKLASSILPGPQAAIADIKRALTRSSIDDLRAQIELESEHQLHAFLSADAAEGMAALMEKRAPRFR